MIKDNNKKQNEQIEKAKRGQSKSDNVFGPNINPNPSSVYNFKK